MAKWPEKHWVPSFRAVKITCLGVVTNWLNYMFLFWNASYGFFKEKNVLTFVFIVLKRLERDGDGISFFLIN